MFSTRKSILFFRKFKLLLTRNASHAIILLNMIDLPLYSSKTLRKEIQPPKFLIENVLWEGDLVMLLGSEKAGKSILATQLASCLTTGKPFLGKYAVPEKKKVMYLQLEGKRSDFIARMNNMNWVVPCDDDLFLHIPKKFLPFNDSNYLAPLEAHILSHRPEVLIIDPIYMAMAGDLIENKPCREFLSTVSSLMDNYNLTVIMVHHDSKPQFEKGISVQRGDKGSYGSVFFRANVDHILYLNQHMDKTRTLTCETQRSGQVLEKERLILVQPNPLLFEIRQELRPSTRSIYHNILRSVTSTREELSSMSGHKLPTVDKAVCELSARSLIRRTDGRPVTYLKL